MMRRLMMALALGAAAGAPAAAQMGGKASALPPGDCDRACLTGIVHAYVDALAKRDPSRAPFASNARFSENAVEMPIGEGLWGTVSGITDPGMDAEDVETGYAAWFGSAMEHGKLVFMAVRLKVEDRKIVEAETVVSRKSSGMPLPAGTGKEPHNPSFGQALTPAQQRPRERLHAIADSYFNTVELNDGQVFAPFAEDCSRLENGISTTAAAPPPPPGAGGPGKPVSPGNAANVAAGCEAQFKLGIYRINKRVRERRMPLIDTERGIVVGTGFFDHANWFDEYKLTDGRTMKTALKWPNSITLLEAFKIVDGKIYAIEAVFDYVPYGMHAPFYGEVKK